MRRAAKLVVLAGALAALPAFICQFPHPILCREQAGWWVEYWKAQGLSQDEVARRFQRTMVQCIDRSIEPGDACLAAAVNFERAQLARAFVSGVIDSADYVGLIRERTEKHRHAVEQGWGQACMEGDLDSDLVPDPVDDCPGTPAFTATYHDGCTDTKYRPPAAPDDKLTRNLLDQFGFISSPDCDGADVPNRVATMKFGYSASPGRPTLAFAVTPATNQPASCTLFYEIRVRMTDGWVALPETSYVSMVFRDWEDTDPDPDRLVFRVSPSDIGERFRMYDLSDHYNTETWRVRVMNGNGITGGWSAMGLQLQPSFGEP